MNTKRTSIIWQLPDSEFVNLVKSSKKMKDIYDFFGLKAEGRSNVIVKERIKTLNIDTSHIPSRTEASARSRTVSLETFHDEWLTCNSEKNRCHVKSYLIKFKLLPYECFRCKNKGVWLDQPISLQLEHKNGIGNDNRLENLCFLCPNCHSQTDTYSGKNIKNKLNESEILALIPQVKSKKELLDKLGYSASGSAYKRLENLLKDNPTIKFLQ